MERAGRMDEFNRLVMLRQIVKYLLLKNRISFLTAYAVKVL